MHERCEYEKRPFWLLRLRSEYDMHVYIKIVEVFE